jgi:hypothetical protein
MASWRLAFFTVGVDFVVERISVANFGKSAQLLLLLKHFSFNYLEFALKHVQFKPTQPVVKSKASDCNLPRLASCQQRK